MQYKKVNQLTTITNIQLDNKQLTSIDEYIKILVKWNNTFNLVGAKSYSQILDEHIVECIKVAPFFDKPNILDIGAGAGLPSVILAIYHSAHNIHALDVSQKKCSFLEHIKLNLKLKNLFIHNQDIKKFTKQDECFDIITARAFASSAKILNISKKIICKNGKYLLLKTDKYKLEQMQPDYVNTIKISHNRYLVEFSSI